LCSEGNYPVLCNNQVRETSLRFSIGSMKDCNEIDNS
jgi:hypothetical protein